MIVQRLQATREVRKIFYAFTYKATKRLPVPTVGKPLRKEEDTKDADSDSTSSHTGGDTEPELAVTVPPLNVVEAREHTSAENARFYDRQLNLENGIRLLRIEPGEGPISVTLEYTNLEASSQYDTLSYCWGKRRAVQVITVNGVHGFIISDHLHAALRRLRRTDEARLLWIDVICVNQTDILERNRSVQLMWKIYAKASRVIIWIGEIEAQQKTCRRLFAATDDDPQLTFCAQPDLSALEHDGVTAKLGDPLSELELESGRSLEGEVWWKRLWVIQEFSRARDYPTVYIGPHAISWAFFAELTHTERRDRLELFHHLRTNEDQSLLELLFLAKSFLCSDPRDRIYALLGLVKGGQTSIVPDYSRPVPEVYEEATLYLIQQEANVDMLMDERLYRSASDYPTWIPHYRELRHRDVVRGKDKYGAGHGVPVIELVSFETDPTAGLCTCHSSTSNALKMRVIPFGVIVARTTERDLPAPDSSHRKILLRQNNTPKAELSRPFQTFEEILDVLHIDFSRPPAYGLDRSPSIGYLMLDYLFNGVRSVVQEFNRCEKIHPWTEKNPNPGPEVDRLTSKFAFALTHAKKLDILISALWENAFLTVRHTGTYIPDDSWRKLLGGEAYPAYQVTSKSYKRDFFSTDLGFVGTGPETLRVGDEIVVPFGASRPFVVRSHAGGTHYEVVGDAVVPGIMSGQLMNLCKGGVMEARDYLFK